jgi:protein-disulfide isomerase
MTSLTRRLFLGTATALPFASGLPAFGEEADPRLGEIVMGDPAAKVEMIEYASFTCPHCKTFHDGVLPRLRTAYIETGKVRFVFRSVFRNRYDLWATMLVRCAGPARFEGLIDAVFHGQASWTLGDDAAVADALKRIGRVAAIPDATLDACLTDQNYANALVQGFMGDPMQARVEGTPTFFIDGNKYPGMAFEKFAEIIDAKLR